MGIEHGIAQVFKMDQQAWMRHCNPWSVWTRMATLPFLALAVWSRLWLEWWALVPVGLIIIWLWLNPRVFSAPQMTNNWASKCVFGERVWLNRNNIPIPQHHQRMATLLSMISAIGTMILMWGLACFLLWPTLLGMVLIYAGKLWFLDRMVWLYEDMKEASDEYRSWLKE